MGRSAGGRGLVLGVSLLALVGFGCTPETVTPTPPPTTSASATPSETAQEREERLAYEAAEKSYREFRAELYRVLRAGGSKDATSTMRAHAAGPYLKYFTEVVQAYKGESTRSIGSEKTGYVRPQGYSPEGVVLDVCEDTRGVRDVDASGRQIGKGEVRTARLDVRKVSGEWKVWDGTGKKAESCD